MSHDGVAIRLGAIADRVRRLEAACRELADAVDDPASDHFRIILAIAEARCALAPTGAGRPPPIVEDRETVAPSRSEEVNPPLRGAILAADDGDDRDVPPR